VGVFTFHRADVVMKIIYEKQALHEDLRYQVIEIDGLYYPVQVRGGTRGDVV
jgi:hypothetical protein